MDDRFWIKSSTAYVKLIDSGWLVQVNLQLNTPLMEAIKPGRRTETAEIVEFGKLEYVSRPWVENLCASAK